MFREMRRKKQQLPDEVARAVLARNASGVLAVLGDDGYPYAVPLSYVYDEPSNRLFFHSAKSGHKIDAIVACDKASFCVVDADDVKPAEYTTYFRSAIAFGRVRIVDGEDAVLAALRMLGDKYNPGEDAALDAEIASGLARVSIIEFEIEHLSAKQALELM